MDRVAGYGWRGGGTGGRMGALAPFVVASAACYTWRMRTEAKYMIGAPSSAAISCSSSRNVGNWSTRSLRRNGHAASRVWKPNSPLCAASFTPSNGSSTNTTKLGLDRLDPSTLGACKSTRRRDDERSDSQTHSHRRSGRACVLPAAAFPRLTSSPIRAAAIGRSHPGTCTICRGAPPARVLLALMA